MARNNKEKVFKNSDLSRYINREMTEGERYDYERRLQKDPFESDALEGLTTLSTEETWNDLGRLHSRLSKIIRPVGMYKIIRVAAIAVVLVGVSSLFLVRELRKSPQMISENIEKVGQEPEIERLVEPHKDLTEREEAFDKMPVEALKAVEAEEEEIYIDKISDKIYEPGGVEKKGAVAGVNIVPVEGVADETKLKYVVDENLAKKEMAEEKQVEEILIEELVVAAEEMVSAPASKSMKRTAIERSEALFLEEDVMVEYGIEEEASAIGAGDVTGYIPPAPTGGLRAFRKYIKEHQQFPESWDESGKEVVRLTFQVGIDSVISNIRIVKSPGDLFTDEVIRLVNEGPIWHPATRNGVAIVDSVKLRIVFRK
ncbi:MAG: energy transducer TonB [Bacteroidales bacterium]|nr:energy transducer TonB [Bacteroidales bacterium]